jgi:3-hydroxyisobutyrate dehydrogenase and related beta-hydroxyacid dehydrogenases
MIDGPVSGGVMGAEAGTLTFMIGGESSDLERARPLLEAMGKNIVHAGSNGAGQTAKICNNMLSGICMIGTTEALALGIANGLDPAVLSEIMRTSSGTNYALQKLNPYPGVMPEAPSSHNYVGGFRSDFQLKDMLLAVQLAGESRTLATFGYDRLQPLRHALRQRLQQARLLQHHDDDVEGGAKVRAGAGRLERFFPLVTPAKRE